VMSMINAESRNMFLRKLSVSSYFVGVDNIVTR
jgi:hypothetical protein